MKTFSLHEVDSVGRAYPVLTAGTLFPSIDWIASELVVGVDVRLTMRAGTCVRIEVQQKPSRDQRKAGITEPWFRDAVDDSTKPDYWLFRALEESDVLGLPDGEWEGSAVGPKIMGNPYRLFRHKIYLSSLVPWAKRLGGNAPITPILPRCPVDFDELSEWFDGKPSLVNPDVQLQGVVWWEYDEPVAHAMAKDYANG